LRQEYGRDLVVFAVAPRAGAWIEISWDNSTVYTCEVAPRAGAWIEIRVGSLTMDFSQVAPRAGAWIEI